MLAERLDLPRGTLRRVSVAILVDQGFHWEGRGAQARKILEPPAPERLKVVKDVVAGVIGFQEERGDQVLVETLPFEATLTAAPAEVEAPKPATRPGFVLPVSDFAPWTQFIAYALPVTSGIALLQELMLRGEILQVSLAGLLAAIGLVLYVFSLFRLRRIMRRAD